MNRDIKCNVVGEYASVDTNQAGVQGEANVNTLRIHFSPEWDAFTKKIIWRDAYGTNPVAVLLPELSGTSGEFATPIPGEALAITGKCLFTIEGYLGTETPHKVAETIPVYLTVKPNPNANGEGSQPVEPTPDQSQQLQAAIDANTKKIDDHISDTGNPHKVTAEQAGADPSGAADEALEAAKQYTDDEVAKVPRPDVNKAYVDNGDKQTLEAAKQYTDGIAPNVIEYSDLGLEWPIFPGSEYDVTGDIPASASKMLADVFNAYRSFGIPASLHAADSVMSLDDTLLTSFGDILTIKAMAFSGPDSGTTGISTENDWATITVKRYFEFARQYDVDEAAKTTLAAANEYAGQRGSCFAVCDDPAASPTSAPNKWYIPKSMPRPSGEVGMMVDVLWANGHEGGLGYDVSLIWGEPGGADNEVIIDKAIVSDSLTGEYSIPAEGTVRYQLYEQSGRKRWQYVSGDLLPKQYSTGAAADVADKPVHGLQLAYLPGMEIYVQLDNGNDAPVMRLVPDEGATLPVYGNGTGAETGTIPAGYILHLANAGDHWQIINTPGSGGGGVTPDQLNSPKHTTMVVTALKEGGGGYKADHTSTEIINHANASGIVVLRYTDADRTLEIRMSGQTADRQALFFQTFKVPGANQVKRVDATVDYAGNVTIKTETIDLSGYVPKTQKINGKALSGDITLTATDVKARPADWNPDLSDYVSKVTTADQTLAGNFAAKYIKGTWFQTTAVEKNNGLEKIAVIGPYGWIYYMDKSQLVNDVIAALPKWTGGSY